MLLFYMPPHPVRLSMMLWIRHVANINTLILIMQSKSSFSYLPNDILFYNLQSLYFVIASNNCSLHSAIHHVVRFVWAGLTSENRRESPDDKQIQRVLKLN